MNKTRIAVIVPFLLALIGPGQGPDRGAQAFPAVLPAPEKGLAAVSSDSLIATVRWLADDAREGRMSGTPGAEAAADWLAARFAACGLEPAGDDGTYLQWFEETVGVGYGDENTLSFTGLPGVRDLLVEEEYFPFAFSESGTVNVPIVFAGYGITAEEYGYDDYEGIDAEGKAVLVLRHEPQQDDSTSVFEGTAHSTHAQFRTKARNAQDHGAVAMLLITGPMSAEYEDDTLVQPRFGEALGGSEILAVHMSREIGEALLDQSDLDVREWAVAVDERFEANPSILDPSIRVRLVVSMRKERRDMANVVARLPGTDPETGAVLIGAHYDHLGRGNSSSLAPKLIGQIHNGADDNASGTAAILELARVYAETGPVKRDLYFAAFVAEEMGLLGSSFMVKNPPVPVSEMQAMINLDMVGRLGENKLYVSGMGSSPAFEPVVENATRDMPFEVSTSKSGIGASDHTSFYLKDVPVLYFFSGLHTDYHKPSDDWEKIDLEGLNYVTRLAYAISWDLANREDRLDFVRVAEDSAAQATGRPSGRGYGPYLGTIPDFGDYEGGVLLAGVQPGSPAERAGIQEGDVVVRFEGKEIRDLYDYTDALRAQKPGDTVTIVVLRDEEEVELRAKLGSRE